MDNSTRAALTAALDRLQAELLLRGADLPEGSTAKIEMVRTLDKIRDDIEQNPSLFDLLPDVPNGT